MSCGLMAIGQESGMPTNANKRVPMWQHALELHKGTSDQFGEIIKDANFYPQLVKVIQQRRRSCAVDLVPIASHFMTTNSGPSVVRTKGGDRLIYSDGSGAWRAELHGQTIHILRCRLNGSMQVEYAVGTNSALLAFYKYLQAASRTRTKAPRKGIWKVHRVYEEDKVYCYMRKSTGDAIAPFAVTPAHTDIVADITWFFENLSHFTRYGQSGMRKLLLTGAPGTGKTTILKQIAETFHKTVAVVFVSSCDELMSACNNAGNAKAPTIVIAEEVDALRKDQVSSDVLSFLDGDGTPRNVAGTLVLFTTNYPKLIDPRIIDRPGRIDRIVAVPPLTRQAAVICGRIFLPDCQHITDAELGKALDKCTPASVKEIVVCALAIARSKRIDMSAQCLIDARQSLKIRSKRAVESSDWVQGVMEEDYAANGASPDHSDLLN
jgi:hypothetical protein